MTPPAPPSTAPDSSIRTILVTVSGSPSDRSVLEAAITTARLFRAHLQVLFVQIDPEQIALLVGAGDPMGTAGLGPMIEELMKDGERREACAQESFEAMCRQCGVPVGAAEPDGASAEWMAVPGIDTACVPAIARAADLLLFVRPESREDAPVHLWQAALLACGKPILLLPPGPNGVLQGTVAIAWKDTPEAARAITAAMPLLGRADRVLIMTVDEGTEQQSEAARRLAAGLRRHNPATSLLALRPDGREPADLLLAEAGNQGVGLLVMGAYGHSRARETVFGGFTRTILRDAKLPVLMLH
jgi:nucleotide-binding universal stress UspA family protein